MTPAEAARAAYYQAQQHHIDESKTWEIVAAAVNAATKQVETDISIPFEQMARRRWDRGREIYGGDPVKVNWLAELYDEILDAWAMSEWGLGGSHRFQFWISDVAEKVLLMLREREGKR